MPRWAATARRKIRSGISRVVFTLLGSSIYGRQLIDAPNEPRDHQPAVPMNLDPLKVALCSRAPSFRNSHAYRHPKNMPACLTRNAFKLDLYSVTNQYPPPSSTAASSACPVFLRGRRPHASSRLAFRPRPSTTQDPRKPSSLRFSAHVFPNPQARGQYTSNNRRRPSHPRDSRHPAPGTTIPTPAYVG
jgi:hypothetical protein